MKIIKKTKYITSFTRNNEPISWINLGETIIVETNDCYCGQIQNENILRSEINGSLVNASTGPIYIKDTFPGDVICVEIRNIQLDNQGLMLSYPGLGPLGDLIYEQDTKIIPIKNGKACFNKEIKFSINPMIGVIGLAPEIVEISCEAPGDHGGNLDTKDIKEGSKVYLPVFVEGGYLALGDLHATMGDGELCGMGVEIGGRVEIKVSKTRTKNIKMPIVETEKEFLIIASDVDFERASKKGIVYATQILQENLNLTFKDAYRILSALCDLRVSQIVNPLLTVRIAIPKKLMPNLFI
jgi:amidase